MTSFGPVVSVIRPAGLCQSVRGGSGGGQGVTCTLIGSGPLEITEMMRINSLRATATIAIRRMRRLAVPTRWRNQTLKGLLGW